MSHGQLGSWAIAAALLRLLTSPALLSCIAIAVAACFPALSPASRLAILVAGATLLLLELRCYRRLDRFLLLLSPF